MVRGSLSQLVTLPGLSLWFFKTWLGLSGALLDIRREFFLFLNALFVLASASSRSFGYSMLYLSVALFPGAEVGCPFAFVTGFVAKTQAPPLLLGLRASLYRPNQWETVISCAGGQVFLVHLGGASSAMRAIHVAAGCSMKEGSTISVSFWLRMPLSRGGWLSVTERSVLCPLSSLRSCCRSSSSL